MVTNNIVASAAVLSPIGLGGSDAFAESLLEPSNVSESRELIESGANYQSWNSLGSEIYNESNSFIESGTASQSKNIPLSSLFAVSDSFEPSERNIPVRTVSTRMGSLSGDLIQLIGGLLSLVIVVSAVIFLRMLRKPGDKVESTSGDDGDHGERIEESLFDLSHPIFTDFRFE
jgi:hypothetical protein